MRKLTDTISVDGQIGATDIRAAAAAGIRLIINNRPDGEEPGQPSAATLEAAAREAGLAYVCIPIQPGQFTPAMIDQTNAVLAGADGPVLAFCRSGTRSTTLWAMARAAAGENPADLVSAAARAGYDLSGLASTLQALSRDATRGG